MPLPRKFSQRARKVVFFVHLWTGLILGLWFVIIGLTGSMLAFRSEATMAEVRWRAQAPLPDWSQPIIAPSRAIALFKQSNPKLIPENGLYVPSKKFGYWYYRINAKGPLNGKKVGLIYIVDPVTGKIYPPISREIMWVTILTKLHVNLIAGAKGAVANGVLSFIALFLLLSGLWLWWPSNWKQFKSRIVFKRGVSFRRTLYDLHNILGIYLFGLLLLLSFSAVALVLDDATDEGIAKAIDRTAKVQPVPTIAGKKPVRSLSGGKMPVVVPSGEMLSVDQLVASAQAILPAKTLLTIKMPRLPDQPFQASFDPIGFDNGLVFLDPYTAKRLVVDGPTHTVGNATMKVIGNLHYGWFGGAWSQFLYALSGLLPFGLYLTGLLMWWKRLQTKTSSAKRRLAQKPSVAETTTT